MVWILLTGEGPTDLGKAHNPMAECTGANFAPGPMSLLAGVILEQQLGYPLIPLLSTLISKREIKSLIEQENPTSKRLVLHGLKRPKGAQYHYKWAKFFGNLAQAKEEEIQQNIIAIFFRDSDGTNSCPSDRWDQIIDSIRLGFHDSGYSRGVPMVPRPKSEAWIVHSIESPPYNPSRCRQLEDSPGNDASPNSLKNYLTNLTQGNCSGDAINNLINQGKIDPNRIILPSFLAFKTELTTAIEQLN